MEDKIQARLFELCDLEYKKFHCSLMPTVAPERVIGVRMPELRRFAKEIIKDGNGGEFIKMLPHKYYEENNIHGIIISSEKDFPVAVHELDRFLPYVDNWATCDLLDCKIFKNYRPELYDKILDWIESEHTYTVRFGIKMLMTYFLDEDFDALHLELVGNIKSDEYYVNMMRAWYFATALAKQYEATVKIFENNRLDVWTHNKAIQKAIESYRVEDADKAYLRRLRRKEKGNAR